MLEALLGSVNKERVLLFIYARGEGYAREISRFYATDLAPVQKQLEGLENGGILASRTAGRTRLYSFDPRYPLLDELKAFLAKTINFYPQEERDRLLLARKRPRRGGKPL